jgi:hypothetical protein
MATMKTYTELQEAIKGWKNAHSDIMKLRAKSSTENSSVKLVRLKKDGSESGMHDSTKTFKSEEDAQRHHKNLVELNPKSNIKHNLYIDGKHKDTLK